MKLLYHYTAYFDGANLRIVFHGLLLKANIAALFLLHFYPENKNNSADIDAVDHSGPEILHAGQPDLLGFFLISEVLNTATLSPWFNLVLTSFLF